MENFFLGHIVEVLWDSNPGLSLSRDTLKAIFDQTWVT